MEAAQSLSVALVLFFITITRSLKLDHFIKIGVCFDSFLDIQARQVAFLIIALLVVCHGGSEQEMGKRV